MPQIALTMLLLFATLAGQAPDLAMAQVELEGSFYPYWLKKPEIVTTPGWQATSEGYLGRTQTCEACQAHAFELDHWWHMIQNFEDDGGQYAKLLQEAEQKLTACEQEHCPQIGPRETATVGLGDSYPPAFSWVVQKLPECEPCGHLKEEAESYQKLARVSLEKLNAIPVPGEDSPDRDKKDYQDRRAKLLDSVSSNKGLYDLALADLQECLQKNCPEIADLEPETPIIPGAPASGAPQTPETSIMTEMRQEPLVQTDCPECVDLATGLSDLLSEKAHLEQRIEEINEARFVSRYVWELDELERTKQEIARTRQALEKCEQEHCPETARTPSQPTMGEQLTRTRTEPRTPTSALPFGYELALSGGYAEMDTEGSAFGVIKEGDQDRVAALSSDRLSGYRFGGSLRTFLSPAPDGEPEIPSFPAYRPSLGLSVDYFSLDDDQNTMIQPGPETAVSFLEQVAGLDGLLTGPFGLNIATESDYQRLDFSLSYTHPLFRTHTGLGTFSLLGSAGLGYSWSEYEVGAWAMIPGVDTAFFQTSWDQEIEEHRPHAQFKGQLMYQPVDRVMVELFAYWHPGYVDAELDSRQRMTAEGADPPEVQDVNLDLDDSFSGWDCRYGFGLGLGFAPTSRSLIFGRTTYEEFGDFSIPDNPTNPAEQEHGIKNEDASIWSLELGIRLQF